MSLETPQANPNAAEDRFEGLWNAGAFNPDGKPDPKQGQQTTQQAPQGQQPQQPEPVAEPALEPVVEPQTEPEGPDYANLDDYLKQTGVERESFLSLPVVVKVDGKTEEVPLEKVIKSYQLEGHVNQKSIALSEQQKALETERAAAQQQIAGTLQQAQVLMNLAHQQLLGQYQGIDWNKLRIEDPAQWAVLNTEFNQRAGQIQQHLGQVQQQMQQQWQAAQQEQMKALPKERDKMLDARPEWRDDKQFQAARGEMASYARKLGFTDAEISGIFDHRYMLALHDAARYAALQAASPQAVKRVRAAPQVASPGARISRDPQVVARQQARETFKKNLRDPDAQARYFGTLV